jgi:hypothetical protein
LSRQISWKSWLCRDKIVEYRDFVAVKNIFKDGVINIYQSGP